ncbi:unnamed protein product [Polarella glacialis]|uniref:Uncharacterized protein n=2 Tax=Polarella glacialis TaxID=89957 RepID=A0A813FY51_POLGL|nr:unnamed protein product [Polarella glacialis]
MAGAAEAKLVSKETRIKIHVSQMFSSLSCTVRGCKKKGHRFNGIKELRVHLEKEHRQHLKGLDCWLVELFPAQVLPERAAPGAPSSGKRRKTRESASSNNSSNNTSNSNNNSNSSNNNNNSNNSNNNNSNNNNDNNDSSRARERTVVDGSTESSQVQQEQEQQEQEQQQEAPGNDKRPQKSEWEARTFGRGPAEAPVLRPQGGEAISSSSSSSGGPARCSEQQKQQQQTAGEKKDKFTDAPAGETFAMINQLAKMVHDCRCYVKGCSKKKSNHVYSSAMAVKAHVKKAHLKHKNVLHEYKDFIDDQVLLLPS